jgi:hypothetical protein
MMRMILMMKIMNPMRIHPLSLWITALLASDVLSVIDEHHNFIRMDLIKQSNAGQRQLTQL